jgi:hypothetical protein
MRAKTLDIPSRHAGHVATTRERPGRQYVRPDADDGRKGLAVAKSTDHYFETAATRGPLLASGAIIPDGSKIPEAPRIVVLRAPRRAVSLAHRFRIQPVQKIAENK